MQLYICAVLLWHSLLHVPRRRLSLVSNQKAPVHTLCSNILDYQTLEINEHQYLP